MKKYNITVNGKTYQVEVEVASVAVVKGAAVNAGDVLITVK